MPLKKREESSGSCFAQEEEKKMVLCSSRTQGIQNNPTTHSIPKCHTSRYIEYNLLSKKMTASNILRLLQKYVRAVEQRGVDNLNADYPYLLAEPEAYPVICDALLEKIADLPFDYVAAIEALGFPIGGAIAHARRVGFISIRKEGSLPGDVSQTAPFIVPYKNRQTRLEIQKDIPLSGKNVLLFDEAIDTGASLTQAVHLLTAAGAQIPSVLTITNYPNIRHIVKIPVISLVYGPF